MQLPTIEAKRVIVNRRAEDKASLLEMTGALVAFIVMSVYAFTVIAPYFFSAPIGELDVIKANQSTVNIITTAVVMFYFGASVGRRKDQDTLSTMAHTNAKQSSALVPPADDTMSVAPGETKTVVGTPEEDNSP